MADYLTGDTFAFEFQVVNLNDDAVTGLTASDFTITVRRRSTGDWASTSPTTTVTDRGSGGYTVTFTIPTDASGFTYWIQVLEKDTFALSAEQLHEDYRTIGAEPGTTTANNAYCGTDDVHSYSQTSITSTTKPSTTEVTAFMVARSAQVYGWMAEKCGTSTPGPASGDYTTALDTTTDIGLACDKVLRQAAALYSAADQLEAAGAGDEPRRGERVRDYFVMAEALQPVVETLGLLYCNTGGRASTHISTGEVEQFAADSGEKEEGITFKMDQKW